MRITLLVQVLFFVVIFPAAAIAADDTVEARVVTFENGLRPAVQIRGKSATLWTLEERMAFYRVPAVSVAVIRNGKLAWARAYGLKDVNINDKVDVDTMFSVGSLSKVGAAVTTLRLVDSGQLELNRNVNEYLTSWQLPENEFTSIRPVTLRGILSHTAGLSVHGFPDYTVRDRLPTVIDTLDGLSPAKTGPVRVTSVPGNQYRYSGGGVTVEQLVISDVTGQSFPSAAKTHVFDPLGMNRSSYVNPLPETYKNVARPHGDDGERDDMEVMPETAASGLWTTPSDYAKLLIAVFDSYQNAENSFLAVHTARDMLTEVGRSSFGLGPRLEGHGVDRYLGHTGSNDSYKAQMELHLASGNGVIIFTNGAGGDNGLRGEIRRAIAAAEDWPLTVTASVSPCERCSGPLQDYAGVYAVKLGESYSELRLGAATAYRVQLEDGSLYLGRAGSRRLQRLIREDHSHFAQENDGSVVEFVRGYDGRVEGLIIREGDYYREGRKMTE